MTAAAAPSLPALLTAKSSTERQLELTLNAIARSMRKAIRLAEKGDPTGTAGPWNVVEHRAGLLETMLRAAAEFTRRHVAPAPEAELASAEGSAGVKPPVAEVPAPPSLLPVVVEPAAPRTRHPHEARRKKPVTNSAQPAKPVVAPAKMKSSGPGWRLAA